MATSNSSIDLTSLDFDSIKLSLKEHLKTNPIFKDYDFEGTNLGILLDLLAVNTYKNAYYLNMAISERFIDSAQVRESLLSHVKELNYTPRSVRSSRAKLNVVFEATGESAPYIIPKGSSFTSMVKNKSFVFTIPESIICSSTNSTFTFTTDVYEGIYVKDTYIFDIDMEIPKFKITNKNVDTTSLTVVVNEDGSVVGENYYLSQSMLGLNEKSPVFFLQTAIDGGYEIVFGDDIIGKKPKHNSLITLDYRIAQGSVANGCREFSIDFNPTGTPSELSGSGFPGIATLELSQNGAEEESIESIRYYAPRHFQLQERAVVASDYEIALKTQFPEINSVSVYGGEEISPPQYGKVFIAVDLRGIIGLPDSKKSEYYSFIKSRNSISIIPEFVNPKYMFIAIDTDVKYNINITKASKERIKNIVTSTINDYNDNYLNKFNATFRLSNVMKLIDESEISIISNSTKFKIYTKLIPNIDLPQNLTIDFNLKLKNDIPRHNNIQYSRDLVTFYSSIFKYNGEKCILADNGDGVVSVLKYGETEYVKIIEVGSINYDTGQVKLNNFKIESFEDNYMTFYAYPAESDISSNKDTILLIEPAAINVDVIQMRE